MNEITIVIPCYNTHEHLPQTLASLTQQTYRDFDTILVNDGSTNPNTLAYLKTLPDWVKTIHQDNQGLAAARNTGFEAAATEYVVPLDADDWLAPTYLEQTLAALKANPSAGFSYTQIAMEGDRNGVLAKHYNLFEQLFFNQIAYCILLPKKIWQQLGGYDAAMLQGYEDWEFNIRLGLAGYKGINVPQPLFHYRISAGGMLQSISQKRHAALIHFIQNKHYISYKWKSLFQLWRANQSLPSTYPKLFYFVWQGLFKILPPALFAALFKSLLRFSSSRRISK